MQLGYYVKVSDPSSLRSFSGGKPRAFSCWKWQQTWWCYFCDLQNDSGQVIGSLVSLFLGSYLWPGFPSPDPHRQLTIGHHDLLGRWDGVSAATEGKLTDTLEGAEGIQSLTCRAFAPGGVWQIPKGSTQAKERVSLDDPGKGQRIGKGQAKSSSNSGEKLRDVFAFETMEILAWGERRSCRRGGKPWKPLPRRRLSTFTTGRKWGWRWAL